MENGNYGDPEEKSTKLGEEIGNCIDPEDPKLLG